MIAHPGRMTRIFNYVYSVIDCSTSKSFGYIGLQGEEVFTVPNEDVSAAVSRIQTDLLLGFPGIESIEANWLKHEEVVRSLMADYTVIPVKFGSVLKTDRDLLVMLRRLSSECKSELRKFRGRVEMGVKVFADDESVNQAASKEPSDISKFRNELAIKRKMLLNTRRISFDEAVERQLDMVGHGVSPWARLGRVFFARKLHLLLSDNSLEAKANTLLASDMILNASYLIEGSYAESLFAKVKQLERHHLGFHFNVSGPWAPYNFTKIKYH